MQSIRPIALACLSAAILKVVAPGDATARERPVGGADGERSIAFDLTFAAGDVSWLGDPASPTATVFVRPGARPVAMDACVRTLDAAAVSPARRYFTEARVAKGDGGLNVFAFTREREKLIGTIDEGGRFAPNDAYQANRDLLPTWPVDVAALAYDPQKNALYREVDVPGPVLSESLDFLPLSVTDAEGGPIVGQFRIAYDEIREDDRTGKHAGRVSLSVESDGQRLELARADVPNAFRREEVRIESFDKDSGRYFTEDAWRFGREDAEPTVTVSVRGEFTSLVNAGAAELVVLRAWPGKPPRDTEPRIVIDGQFDDWRNVAGVDDPRGDLVPYLDYVADVDLLEFKVAHDDERIYLYARVAGQVGRSHPEGGRCYFYAYMDVDQNPGTGFLPTRDDDCYFGVDIGDDCEVQFEFVNNEFRKSFYGFCGLGGDDDVLRQRVTIGKSQYGRFDEDGNERAAYKSEYIYRNGRSEITEDLQEGTSDTIQVAISPSGREVEISSLYAGFLKDRAGRPIVQPGQTIDIAAGMECDSKAYPGKTRWAADSTIAVRGYRLRRSGE
jgi:hypothetical protein